MIDFSLWPLLGILVVMLGFLLKFNPVLVVTVAALLRVWRLRCRYWPGWNHWALPFQRPEICH